MSYKNAKFIDLVDKQWSVFAWWLIDNVQSNKISYKNSPEWKNFRIFWYWTLIRPWFSQFWSTFTWAALWTAPFWIGSYLRAASANDRIVVWMKTDTDKYLISITEAWVQTAVTTGANITVATRMNFVNIGDSLYCMNGTNGLGKLDWTTYTIANALTFKFWVYFNWALWASWNSSAPNKVYKSITDTPWTFTWWDSDEFTFPEVVTWITWNNTVIYVFSENTLSYFNTWTIRDIWGALTYQSMPLDTNGWLTNSNCVISAWKYAYYLSKANKIKRVAPWQWPQWFDVEDLTHRLWRWIELIMANLETDQSNAFAYYDQDNEIIKFHVRTKWSTYNDVVIWYSTMFDEFYYDTNKSFFWWIYFKKKSYTISQLTPKIYIDEYWQSDDWAPIQFDYWTKRIDLWIPHMLKEIWQSRTFLSVNSLIDMRQRIYADWALIDTYTITSADVPVDVDWIGTLWIGTYWIWEDWDLTDQEFDISIIREKWDLQRRAKYFQFRYTNASLWGKCTLQNLLPRIETLSELTFPTNN